MRGLLKEHYNAQNNYGFKVSIANASHSIRNFTSSLHSIDRLMIGFWSLLSIICLALLARLPAWWIMISANLLAAFVTISLAWAAQTSGWRLVRWVHDWAAFPLVIFTYKELYYLIGFIRHGSDYDRLLIAMDHALFGVNPTEWLARFSTPYITEALQIAYSLFYVLFIAAGIELYQRRDLLQFRYFRSTVVYGFFLSYIGYFILPAVGPRFTLHDFSKLNAELPGLLFTPFLRWFVDFFESIPEGVSSSVALASAQRDAFPSGHTMLTIIIIILAYRFRLKIRHCLLGTGTLLIIATVYLRYHYVVDIIAGALLVLPCILTSDKIFSLLKGNSE